MRKTCWALWIHTSISAGFIGTAFRAPNRAITNRHQRIATIGTGTDVVRNPNPNKRVTISRIILYNQNVNPKIIDYKTVRAFESERSKFDDMVLESICSGWQPFGSPYTVTVGGHVTFCQAMVRYEEAGKLAGQPDKPRELKEQK
jgi:hypothetical protein